MDIEVFLAVRGHVVGVRIKSPGHGIEKPVVMILQGFLVQAIEEIFEALADPLAGLLPQCFLIDALTLGLVFLFQVQVAVHDFRFEDEPPAPLEFGLIGCKSELFRVSLQRFPALDIETAGKQRINHLLGLVNAQRHDVITGSWQGNGAAQQVVIDQG